MGLFDSLKQAFTESFLEDEEDELEELEPAIPFYLKEVFQLDEKASENKVVHGSLRCPCGCDQFALSIWGDSRYHHIAAKKAQKGPALVVQAQCVKCGRQQDIFDMSRHGYSGFVNHDGETVPQDQLEILECPKCKVSSFLIDMQLLSADRAEFVDQMADDEEFSPEDYVNAFEKIKIHLRCSACQGKWMNWLRQDTF